MAGVLEGTGECFKHNACVDILYLSCRDIMLSILYVYRSTYVHITAAIIGEMIKSSTFHDINKCITASEQMIINVGSDNICQVER